MRLLLTRPENDSRRLAAQLEAWGHKLMIEPLLAIEPLADEKPLLSGVQALLFTSRHAISAFATWQIAQDLPLFAVGEASARHARTLGFQDVSAAPGRAPALAPLLSERLNPEAGALYYGRAENVAFDLEGVLSAAGFTVKAQILYRARARVQLSSALASALIGGNLDGAIFCSARTAESFVRLLREKNAQAVTQTMTAFCLSARVAKALAGSNWQRIITAESPQVAALLAELDPGKRPGKKQ